MKKIAYVLAILAAASTAAVAKDLKQDQKSAAPAVSATQMTDSEMDKVTAGAPGQAVGEGTNTALDVGGKALGQAVIRDHDVVPGTGSQFGAGVGRCTAGRC
jgi:hypothetical protein